MFLAGEKMIDQRVQKLRRFLQSENIDAALIVQPGNFDGFRLCTGPNRSIKS
jgi:hypothetical protein